jgi:deoxyadenosine/deoxycytidine kinase
MPVISIEGNIGSGKSTILKEFKKVFTTLDGYNKIIYVDEPVSQWEQIKSKDGKNMIELFYADPVKYSFSFQMMAYISRLILLKEAIRKYPDSVIITERCLLTDYNIFASMLYEQGKMSEEEYAIYKKWFQYFQTDVVMSAIIYIQCDPEVSHDRCTKRCRPGESISLDYLIECHNKHETWMKHENVSTLTINNDTPMDSEHMDTVLLEMVIFIDDLDEHVNHPPKIDEVYLYTGSVLLFMIFVICFIH